MWINYVSTDKNTKIFTPISSISDFFLKFSTCIIVIIIGSDPTNNESNPHRIFLKHRFNP